MLSLGRRCILLRPPAESRSSREASCESRPAPTYTDTEKKCHNDQTFGHQSHAGLYAARRNNQ